MRVALRPRGRTARTPGSTRPHRRPTPLPLVPLITIVALALVVVCPRAAAAQDSAKEEIETCLSCHSDDSLSVTFADGQSHALAVDQNAFAHSVHGDNLKCTDCHAGMGEIPHPERQYKDLPQFRASFREACKSCHFDNYTQSLDGVHYTLLAKGDNRAPACADCHGAHASSRAGKPRAAISQHLRALPRGRSRTCTRRASTASRCSTATTTCRSAPTATGRTTSPTRASARWLVQHARDLRPVPHQREAHGEVRPVAERRLTPTSPTSTA